MKKFAVLALVAILACGSLTACNDTLHGAGEDIEDAGENIQRNTSQN